LLAPSWLFRYQHDFHFTMIRGTIHRFWHLQKPACLRDPQIGSMKDTVLLAPAPQLCDKPFKKDTLLLALKDTLLLQ
jgi:hypothetical protein